MQQRISHDFVDDEIVAYRARSGRRSLLPVLSFGLVLAVVVGAGMLGSRVTASARSSPTAGVPLDSPAAIAAAPSAPSATPTPAPTASPTPTPSPVLEYIGLPQALDLSAVPSQLTVATIAPQRLQGATLPQATPEGGFAASGTKIAFAAWDSIRVVDLESPRFSATVAHTGTCAWVPEMASTGDLLAYALLRPATGFDDGCGSGLRQFEWQVWLTDFSGSKPTLVAHGQATRPQAEMPPAASVEDDAPWRPHLAMSATWLAWSEPNGADSGGSQAVRAVSIADPAAAPISLATGGRVTQLVAGGSLLAAAVLVGPVAVGQRPVHSLELTDAPEKNPFRTVAAIEGPVAVDPDGSSIAWRSDDPTPGVFVADATGTPTWSWAPDSPAEVDGAAPAFAAIDATGVMWVAATTLNLGGTSTLFVVSHRWSQGAVIVDAPAPRWGRLDGGRLTWVGDDPAGGLAAMTVYLDSLATVDQ